MKLASFFRIPFLYRTPPMADSGEAVVRRCFAKNLLLKVLKNAQKITCVGFCLFDIVVGSENLLKKDCDEDELL